MFLVLAEQTASHRYSNTGTPTNAADIRNIGTKADMLTCHRQVTAPYPNPCKWGFLCPLSLAGISSRATRSALLRPLLTTATSTVKIDRTHSGTLRAPQHDKINLPQTKIALHRNRLRFLNRRNFSVLFFYKTDGQTPPVLAALRRLETEKTEKCFSIVRTKLGISYPQKLRS